MTQQELWLVFDLGGVLFDFHGIQGLAEITGRSDDTIHASLKHSPACRLFESGRIAPVIDSVMPLADAAAAHRRIESSAHIGKIILKVD